MAGSLAPPYGLQPQNWWFSNIDRASGFFSDVNACGKAHFPTSSGLPSHRYNPSFGASPMRLLGKALTFDDVLLVPAFSQVLPKDTSLATRLSRNITLNLPL